MNPIFALVGASGTGKTTLILEAIKRLPNRLKPVRVMTSRARRGPEDDVFCRFLTAEKIREHRDRGELIQYLEYAGNVYGCARKDVEEATRVTCGIQAYVESGILDLERAGFFVIPIHVTSDHTSSDPQRITEDAKRAETHIAYRFSLHNSFEAGGLKRAVDELVDFIEKTCAHGVQSPT